MLLIRITIIFKQICERTGLADEDEHRHAYVIDQHQIAPVRKDRVPQDKEVVQMEFAPEQETDPPPVDRLVVIPSRVV
jgi:hypothetical protein